MGNIECDISCKHFPVWFIYDSEAVSELPYGREVDIWALGCVFYVILVGRTPFAGTSKEVFQKINAASYAMPDKLPWEAKDLICSILQKHPQKRPQLTRT